jgi:hypothetical protein
LDSKRNDVVDEGDGASTAIEIGVDEAEHPASRRPTKIAAQIGLTLNITAPLPLQPSLGLSRPAVRAYC